MAYDHPKFDDHEQILVCHDQKVGLKAIIAIHSTVLGPAAGGCRMYPYETFDQALTDVLRLSRGMTYKNALAGLPLGGGKSVILADPEWPEKPLLLRAFADHVQSLDGRYWTAIDVGVGPQDAEILAERCDYIFARAAHYDQGFNPAAYTALGGLVGIRAAVKTIMSKPSLKGLRIAVQGLGGAGYALAKYLSEAGARLTVADIRQDVVERAIAELGVEATAADRIHAADVDVFCPCAMGAGLNEKTIPDIKAKIVCGLANNQLAEPQHAQLLHQRDLVYVPDFVVNAGGVMGASRHIFAEPSHSEALRQIHGIEKTVAEILKRANTENRPASEIADVMARKKIEAQRPTDYGLASFSRRRRDAHADRQRLNA